MTDQDTKGAEWRTYWSGRATKAGAGALGEVGIEQDAQIIAFWQQKLAPFGRSSRFLDLACGVGSIVRHASTSGFEQISGLDISPDAIAMMTEAWPGAEGYVGSAHDMPFGDASMDVVASQFGFEYAGMADTLPEIARILADDGVFVALVHMSEGDIARECRGHLEAATAFTDTGFVDAAKRVFEAVDALSANPDTRADYDQAIRAMRPAQEVLTSLARNGHKLATHALRGTGELFQRRQNFTLDDILGWLDGLTAENQAHIQRMNSMLEAAITRQEAEDALKALSALGLETSPLSSLELGETKDPVAWILEARKPAA